MSSRGRGVAAISTCGRTGRNSRRVKAWPASKQWR